MNTFLEESNQVQCIQLLAAAEPHSRAWLDALPMKWLSLLLDEAIWVSVALRLGISVCLPHRCKCGTMVDSLGHHQLLRPQDPGHYFPRHAAISGIIHHSLAAAGVLTLLTP